MRLVHADVLKALLEGLHELVELGLAANLVEDAVVVRHTLEHFSHVSYGDGAFQGGNVNESTAKATNYTHFVHVEVDYLRVEVLLFAMKSCSGGVAVAAGLAGLQC